MIKNGRPYTNENGWEDDSMLVDLSPERQRAVLAWIDDNVKPAHRTNTSQTSYGLKHLLEDDTGIYLTNNQFKDAMWEKGYKPVDPKALNWLYKIKKI